MFIPPLAPAAVLALIGCSAAEQAGSALGTAGSAIDKTMRGPNTEARS